MNTRKLSLDLAAANVESYRPLNGNVFTRGMRCLSIRILQLTQLFGRRPFSERVHHRMMTTGTPRVTVR